jgi:hypothetical protein
MADLEEDDPHSLYEGPNLAATLAVRLGLMEPDEATAYFTSPRPHAPSGGGVTQLIANAKTPQQIGQASGAVARLLLAGEIEPQSARTALYALQVALTAANLTLAKAKAQEKMKCKSGKTASPKRRKRNQPR